MSVEWVIEQTDLDAADSDFGAAPPRPGLIVNVSMTGATLLVHDDFPPRIRDRITMFNDDGTSTALTRWVERLAVDGMIGSRADGEQALVSHRIGIEFTDLIEPLASSIGDYASQLQAAALARTMDEAATAG